MSALALLASLLLCACAQDTTSTPLSDGSNGSSTTSALAETSIVSLWLPMGSPDQVDASIISAAPNVTAFALGCLNSATTTGCGFNPPVTITEGESTVVWTNTHDGQEDVSYNIPPQTIECALVGAHTTQSPLEGATSAVCTARSVISGLGIVASTSTLASSEINYMGVTVTAGVEKLRAASEAAATAVPESTASQAEAPIITAMAKIGLSGALGVAVLGVI